jgi:hypothetical protein
MTNKTPEIPHPPITDILSNIPVHEAFKICAWIDEEIHRKLTEQASKEGGGMRWVNASGKLPGVLDKEYIVRHIETGQFFGSFYNGRGASVLDNFPDQYEWLDEGNKI